MWNNLIVGCLLVSSTIVCCVHGAGYPTERPDNPLEIPTPRPADSAIAADEHTDEKFVQTVKPDQLHDDHHHHHHYHGEDGKYDPKDDGTGWDIRKSVPGEPDKDYPTYHTIPQTDFSCSQKQPGAYPDIQTGCQVYRYCMGSEEKSKMISFICPSERLYDENSKTCDWWFKVKCDDENESIMKNNFRRNSANYEKDKSSIASNNENITQNLIPRSNEEDIVKENVPSSTVTSFPIASSAIEETIIESSQLSVPQSGNSKHIESTEENPASGNLDYINQALLRDLYLKDYVPQLVQPLVNQNLIPMSNETNSINENISTSTVNSLPTTSSVIEERILQSTELTVQQFSSSKTIESIKENLDSQNLDRIQQTLFKEKYLKNQAPQIIQPKFNENANIYGSLEYKYTEASTRKINVNVQNRKQNILESKRSDNINIILAHNGKKVSLDELTQQFDVKYYNPNVHETKLAFSKLSSDARKHEENLALLGLTQIKGIRPELSLFDGPFNPNVEPIIRHPGTFPKLDAKHQKLLEKFISIPTNDAYNLGLLKGTQTPLPPVTKEKYVFDPTQVDIRGISSIKQNGGEKIQNGGGLNLNRPKRVYSLEELYSSKVNEPIIGHILKEN